MSLAIQSFSVPTRPFKLPITDTVPKVQKYSICSQYETDELFPNRLPEDLRSPNSFGSRILELCKSSGLRIGNGRIGQDSSKITFSNKNGCSINDYLMMSHDSLYNTIKTFKVCHFNTFSCHAPLHVEI
jgi:hypothetical protein